MQDFRRLKIWERSHALALAIYRATSRFPVGERYALTFQLRKAVLSVPTNIAEGSARGSDADFGRFLQIAMGSASETQYLPLLARDLGYLTENSHSALERDVTEIKRMLAAFLQRLKSSSAAFRRDRAGQ